MGLIKQYYDIKFPFTQNNLDGFFLDLNEKIEDKIASDIVHVILTPKRTRIRRPDFGTDLIKFIFEPNDKLTWESVESEIKESVHSFIPSTTLESIEIIQKEDDDNTIFIDMKYTVKKGNTEENKELVVKI